MSGRIQISHRRLVGGSGKKGRILRINTSLKGDFIPKLKKKIFIIKDRSYWITSLGGKAIVMTREGEKNKVVRGPIAEKVKEMHRKREEEKKIKRLKVYGKKKL